ITVNNFDLAAALGASGYLGIKLDPTVKPALIQGASPNFWSNPNADIADLAGRTSTLAEGNGKSFTVYLNEAAKAGETVTLSLGGALAGDGLKATLGDSTVDANGATITLAEGQTEVPFSLTQQGGLNADATGSLSVTYHSADNQSATSNTFTLNLK